MFQKWGCCVLKRKRRATHDVIRRLFETQGSHSSDERTHRGKRWRLRVVTLHLQTKVSQKRSRSRWVFSSTTHKCIFFFKVGWKFRICCSNIFLTSSKQQIRQCLRYEITTSVQTFKKNIKVLITSRKELREHISFAREWICCSSSQCNKRSITQIFRNLLFVFFLKGKTVIYICFPKIDAQLNRVTETGRGREGWGRGARLFTYRWPLGCGILIVLSRVQLALLTQGQKITSWLSIFLESWFCNSIKKDVRKRPWSPKKTFKTVSCIKKKGPPCLLPLAFDSFVIYLHTWSHQMRTLSKIKFISCIYVIVTRFYRIALLCV